MKKSKTFARKIVAIVLAVLMAMSTFTGVLTVFAKSTDDAHDSNLAANFMTWAETTDNQTCEALLDWVDDTLGKANISPLSLHYDYVVVKIDIDGYIDSVDGIINLVKQIKPYLDQYGGLLGGDIPNINLDPIASLSGTKDSSAIVSQCNESYRALNDAKDIVMALAKTIYWNSNDDTAGGRANKNVIGQFFKGELSLGSILNGVLDVYGLIGNIAGLGMWSGYQSNLVYNILAQAILTKTNWFTESEISNYQAYLQDNSKGTKWNFDNELLEKLTSEFISKISVEMTYALEKDTDKDGKTVYNVTDSSKSRYTKIIKYLDDHNLSETDANIATASQELGYDPNLRYDKNGNGMIYIFRYGNDSGSEDTLEIKTTDKFYDIVNKALKIAWKTVLRPTLSTMRVNNSMDWYKDHGGNFDNIYYYWLAGEGLVDKTDWKNNYTPEKFQMFAAAKYADYGCADAEEFTEKVRKTFEYDRNVVEDPQYNWRDVAKSNNYVTEEGRTESILFGKLRYSPLADKVFNMQTGPINLYFMQTGFPNLEKFMDAYVDGKTAYPNVAAALNNALVAAVKDLFPNSTNIGMGADNTVNVDLNRPELKETGTNPTVSEIASTLVENACKMFEYGANAADENILNAFYHNNDISDKTSSNNLSEANFEEAMIPLLVGCIKIVKDTESIHNEDFDYAKDAEGVAYVALREYLSFSQPNKDYDQLVTTKSGSYEAAYDVNGDNKKTMFEDAILPMCRDAVGYLLSSIVPCRDKSGNVWDFSKSDPVNDKTTLFDLLNSVVCYYASTERFDEPSYNKTTAHTYGKGVAALLGVVDENGNCLVKMSNSLWQNLSEIANKIWPTIGTLQYGTASKAGQANAEELIYDTVVKSLINISDTHGSEGTRGITTIVKQLLTIFTAEPIMNKGVDVLIYDDVVASLVNGIFGAKVSGQAYKKVIPTSTDMNTTTPFDSLVNANVFAKYKGDGTKENGVIGILISNIYCAFGGVTAVTNKTRGDGCWQGAMFAVKGVSYFVDGFVPQLKDHKFGAASISVNNPSTSDFDVSKQIKGSYVTIKNESTGLNRFYKDANGNIAVDDRYFIEVLSLTSNSSSARLDSYKGIIAPEKSVRVEIKGEYPKATENVKFTLKYNIYKGTSKNPTKELKYSNQTAVAYFNLSADKGWYGTLTERDNDTNAAYKETMSDCAVGYYYDEMVLSSTNPKQAAETGIEVYDIDGMYATTDATGKAAYAAFDTATRNKKNYIDVINNTKYDYRIDTVNEDGEVISEGTWNLGASQNVNGVTVYNGYTRDEADAKIKAAVTDNTKKGVTRTHIACSTEIGVDSTVITQVMYDDNGNVEKVAVDPKVIASGAVTASTPSQGINFLTLDSDSTAQHRHWLKLENQVSSIKPEDYTMHLYAYLDGVAGTEVGDVDVKIADTSGAATLQKSYESTQEEMGPYQPSDYDDYNDVLGTSATYDDLQGKYAVVLDAIAKAPTAKTAASFAGVKELTAQTSVVKSATGDPAYKPATTVSAKVAEKFYKNPKNGIYYVDENYKFPVFSNELLKDADVTNGVDSLGRKVEKQGEVYYLVNDYSYEKTWDTASYDYPYYADTTTVAQYEDGKDTEGNPIMKNYYVKTLHNYYSENGIKVNASDKWAYTYAQVVNTTKKNDGKNDYRSIYGQVQDYLTYYKKEILKHIDTSSMVGITGEEGLMETRKGMESVNYDVTSYEKMVQIAKEAEALVYVTSQNADGTNNYSTTATAAQLIEAKKQFDDYFARVVARGYEGKKIEKEIADATGTTKASITATFDENKDTGVITNGVVKFNGTPKYGKIVNGTLVNQGDVVYSDETWTNYVNALAKAVGVAQEEKSANISNTYVAKKNLVIAENELALPKQATEATVTGTVYAAVDGTGTAGSYALGNAKIYNGSKLLATAKADGTFSAEIPVGETVTLTVKAANAVERTVTFTQAASGVKIGLVAIDYNGDGKVNSTDVALASKTSDIGTKVTADQFKAIMRSGVHYSSTLQ